MVRLVHLIYDQVKVKYRVRKLILAISEDLGLLWLLGFVTLKVLI
jgi:hypothetical protein